MTLRKDHPYPDEHLGMYHWAPTSRRKSIQKRGLVPGSTSLQDRRWKPPYICFCSEPILAWQLSGALHDDIPEWDLWMVSEHAVEHRELLPEAYKDIDGHYIKEYRVYERVFKRDLFYVASRPGVGFEAERLPR